MYWLRNNIHYLQGIVNNIVVLGVLFNYILHLMWTELLKYHRIFLFHVLLQFVLSFHVILDFILHIALKDSFTDAALFGSSYVDNRLIGIYFSRSKTTPFQIDYKISLPFTNSLWIFKSIFSFNLVNVAVYWSVPGKCG